MSKQLGLCRCFFQTQQLHIDPTQLESNQLSLPVLQESQLRPIRVRNGREPGDLTGGEQLGPLQMLLFGALSGASAEAVVYPMEVIRRRMQVQAASASTAGQSSHSLVIHLSPNCHPLVTHLLLWLELGNRVSDRACG